MSFPLYVTMLTMCLIALQCKISSAATGHGSENDPTTAATVPVEPITPLPSESSDKDSDTEGENSADTLIDDTLIDGEAGREASASGDKEGSDDKKGSGDKESGNLLSPRTKNGSEITPATVNMPNKPVTSDTNKETSTIGTTGSSSRRQSLSPTSQNRPAKKPTVAKPTEKDATLLHILKSTTSTALPTDSNQTSITYTTEAAKGKSTASTNLLFKLSQTQQSLDKKDSIIYGSSFFALLTLVTFIVMAAGPAL